MTDMMDVTPFLKDVNYVCGAVIAILSMIFGDYWWLFAAFLVGNVLDYVTGWIKFRLKGVESSTKGLKGVIKKFGYWVMILLSFGMSAVFIRIGQIVGMNLEITELLGWFVLGSLLINEIRSILENLVEAGYHPPEILIKSLEVADKALNTMDGNLDIFPDAEEQKDIYRINLDIPLEELDGKDEIRLKVNKKE